MLEERLFSRWCSGGYGGYETQISFDDYKKKFIQKSVRIPRKSAEESLEIVKKILGG